MGTPLELVPRGGRVILLVLPLAAAAAGAAWVLFGPSVQAPRQVTTAGAADAEAQAAGTGAVPPAAGVLVDVSGAVAHPGVYRLGKSERASAAVDAAGGLTAEADTARLPNLAAKLKDGQQIKIPFRSAAAARTASPRAASPKPPGPRAASVDLNQAAPEELIAVPGFDADLVDAVIVYRGQYGGFASIRELVTVLGMSEAEYAVARKYIRV